MILGGAIFASACGTTAADSAGAATDAAITGGKPTAAASRPKPVRRNVLPAGSTVSGQVTSAEGSGRVKGRAQVAFQFNTLTTGGETYDMQTAALSRVASATKSEDATKIGIGAGAGAVIGALLGGKSGAAKGAAVGGGAGTGVVLATKGEEMRLTPGADVTTTLTAPLTVRVRIS
ncbi:MAG: hypothetical protein DMF87_27685 [Acidobacteria bacterium]|nr:MAG: hypothetical protein DMF87_27685 [Acidobacteriota bacterium]